MNWFLVVEIFTTLAEFLIAYIFFKEFLGQKRRSIGLSSVCAVLYVVIILGISRLFPIGVIGTLSPIIVLILLPYLFGKNVKLNSIASVLLIIFMMLSDLITINAMSWIAGVRIHYIVTEEFFLAIGFIISKLFLLLIIKMVLSFRKKDNVHLSFQYWIALLVIPPISAISIFVIFYLNYLADASTLIHLSFISMVGLLYVNILVFQLFEFFLKKHKMEMEKAESAAREKLLMQQVEIQNAHAKNLEFSQKITKEFRHDFKNTLIGLYGLIENNQNEEAIKSISSTLDLDSINKDYVFTENGSIDAIFNDKLRRAESLGIKASHTIMIPANLALESYDISVIFGNSLDNAIEACERITTGEKCIKITLMYQDEKRNLVYQIINSTDGKVVKGNKFYNSSKACDGVHGLGLENIEKAVNKYKGILETEHKNNIFELTIVLNI